MERITGFFKNLQTEYIHAVMMNKERSTHFVNFMTPKTGVLSTIYSRLIAIVLARGFLIQHSSDTIDFIYSMMDLLICRYEQSVCYSGDR